MKKLPQDLSQLVHQSGILPDLAERAELLLSLDKYVKQLITGPVNTQLKVANLRHNVLVIETPTSAWAARVNFQKTKLLQQLQTETLPMLTAIEVKVNPALAATAAKPKVIHRELSKNAAEHLNALAEHTEGTLGQKLKRLAQLASRSTKNSD